MADEREVATLDCQSLTNRQISESLRSAQPDTTLQLLNIASGRHGVAAGVESHATVILPCSVGDFAGLLGRIANLDVHGTAGNSLGHSLLDGRLVVRGSAGDHVAAYASGGYVIVLGSVGFRCGFKLNGGDVFIRGSAGDEAACLMREGALVLGNGAGENTGWGMSGGTLYVRGEMKSISQDIKPIRMKDADTMRLSLLLARAGIKGNTKEFKAFRPKTRKSG